MMCRRRTLALATGVFAILITLASGGCATQGEKMVESFNTTRDKLNESQQHVDATLATLIILRQTPLEQMKTPFVRYKDQVSQLESDAQQAQWRAKEMATEQENHIKQWQKDMADIKDPTIKSSLESRREAARTNYKLIRLYADDIKTAYGPFVQKNKDIIQALSIDLSPAAFNSLGPSIDQLTTDGVMLKQKIAAMQNAMNNVAQGVSPLGM